MRDSDENTRVSNQGRWARVVDMVNDTNRMLATGASWSGHERNHLFFGGLPNHQFERLSGISGLDDPADSRAFATLDFDHDGWLDIALVNISAPRLRLMRNEIGERASSRDNGFIVIRFVGGNQGDRPTEKWTNRDGLGTRVEIDLNDSTKVYREHRLDDGFKAQNSGTMIVGIGSHDAARSINVRWLSGRVQTVSNVSSGTLLTIYEDPSTSPSGKAFVREQYGELGAKAARPLADAGEAWKSRLLPQEPSSSTLVIDATGRPDPNQRQGGLVLYTTMATWCAICATEMPELNAIRTAFSADELAMFGVPIDKEDTRTKLQAWAGKYEPPYNLLIGLPPSEVDKVNAVILAELRDGGRVPATIVTDSTGRVLLASWGIPTVSELRKLRWETGRH